MNCISKPAIGHKLPKGLKLISGYSPLGPGSCRVSTVIENSTDTDITIPARTVVCQLGLANKIPKLIYPEDDYENESECYISMNFQFVGLFWDVFTVPVNHP